MKKEYIFFGGAILVVGFWYWNNIKTATTNTKTANTTDTNISSSVTSSLFTPSVQPFNANNEGSITPNILINQLITPIPNADIPFTPVTVVAPIKQNGGGGRVTSPVSPDIGTINYQKLMTYANQAPPLN
jgi:hypothetical protein